MMKVIGIIVGFIAVVAVGFFVLHMVSKTPLQEEVNAERTELSGTYVCLPQKEGTPVTTDCAVGIVSEDGTYYAIDLGLLSQDMPQLVEGDRISAMGIITPIERLSTDYWQKYPVIGIFSVTDSLEIAAPPLPQQTSANTTLTATKWVWQHTDLKSGERRASADDAYVLTFNEDGMYVSTTDCNGLNGTYVRDGEVLSLAEPGMTKMFCEGSEEMAYVSELALVNSFIIEGDTLRLNLNRDYGTMIFQKQQP